MLPLTVTRDGRVQPVGAIAAFGCMDANRLTPRHLEQIAIALQTSTTTVVEGKPVGLGGRTGERA
jgi:hypothetical protein